MMMPMYVDFIPNGGHLENLRVRQRDTPSAMDARTPSLHRKDGVLFAAPQLSSHPWLGDPSSCQPDLGHRILDADLDHATLRDAHLVSARRLVLVFRN